MKFAFAADTHLHPAAWSSLPGVSGDSYKSFEQVVDLTIENQCSALVLGGDIFDAHPPADAVHCFLRGARKLGAAGVSLFAIQGQHGRSRTIPWTSIDGCCDWFHEKVIGVGGHACYGLDNLPSNELQEALTKVPEHCTILVLHQLCKGTVGDREGVSAWDLDPQWVPPHVRLVLIGDYHAPWEYTKKLDCGLTTRFIYPGSINMQALDEPPAKSFLIVNNDLSVERVPLKTRPFGRMLVLSEDVMPQALKDVATFAPETLMHVKYDSRILDVEQRFRAANDKVHYAFRVTATENINGKPEFVQPQTLSLEGCLAQCVKPEEQPELHSFVLSLLKSKNVKDTVEKHKIRVLGEIS